jgi:hypothetical protein
VAAGEGEALPGPSGSKENPASAVSGAAAAGAAAGARAVDAPTPRDG